MPVFLSGMGKIFTLRATIKPISPKVKKVNLQSARSERGPKYILMIEKLVYKAAPPQAVKAEPKKGAVPKTPKAKGSLSFGKNPASTL